MMKITPQAYRKEAVKPIWCPGCGDYAVLSALQKSFSALSLKPEEIIMVSGIGCSGRFSHYFNTYALHGTHGRAIPTALGAKAARPDLTVLAVGGDGDGLSIGGGHISHAARKNPDITYLLLDNNIYGLTKGQTSPTTPTGYQSKTAPYGVSEDPMDPIPIFITYGISFIARAHSFDVKQMTALITAAIKHRGMSIVYIHSPCVNYQALSWDKLREQTKELPADFPVDDKMKALVPAYSKDPLYTGVFYKVMKPTLEDRLEIITETARKSRHGLSVGMSAKQVMEDFR
ncbi:MAG: 2-oxoacid:ferredoxin oxidoreductase subunit beta [Spirochaetales bacterium]|nr:2-oxoacid:ferredoxin oxidoreductase subunit beta [Spirochaetales bacterium]